MSSLIILVCDNADCGADHALSQTKGGHPYYPVVFVEKKEKKDRKCIDKKTGKVAFTVPEMGTDRWRCGTFRFAISLVLTVRAHFRL